MFRLIKLALYALVGYALYEVYQGMSQGSGGGGGGFASRGAGGGRSREFDRAANSSQGRYGTLTGGEGQGESTMSQDASGASVPHQVGRGVTGT
jgi:hypothetical protein